MTYRPRPIDFCDHVGHGLCADCPDDPQTVDDVTIDIDGDTYARLAAAADAAGESVDDVAERALAEPTAFAYSTSMDHVDCDCDVCASEREERDADDWDPSAGVAIEQRLLDIMSCADCAEMAAPLCPAHSQRPDLRTVLRDLLAAYPRLSSEFSTAEQQRAVRAARAALGGGK